MSYATLINVTDPFRPAMGKEVSKILPGRTLMNVVRKMGIAYRRKGKIRLSVPFILTRNNVPVMQANWDERVHDQDVIAVVRLPGNGGGGSNPLQILAMVAVIIVSFWMPGALGYSLTAWQGAAIAAGTMLAGNLLISLMFPAAQPSLASSNRESASPTYSLNAQGNTARLFESIPVLYGRNKTFPDYASQPYTEINGNDQYIYQLFCISQGELAIEKILIDDNDLTSFGEVQYEIVQPYQPVKLFPTNVVTPSTIGGLEMIAPNDPSFSVLGPFIVNGPNTLANALAVDVSLPQGAYHIEGDGSQSAIQIAFRFEYRQIDNTGAAIGDWQLLSEQTLNLNTVTPQRFTYKITVPEGRYQVRGYRTNNAQTDGRAVEKIYWDSARGYLVDDNTYGNVTLLAIIIKATNNLNSSTANKISVISTRKLQTWNPIDGWSVTTTPTTSPAWAAADVLRDATYGRALPTSKFNIQTLYNLSLLWASRGDTFGYAFDTTTQLWDALTKICRVGRTVPIYYAGKIEFVRNQPQTLPVGSFQPANITKGSFSTTYQFPDINSPDYVIAQYIDPETWDTATVDCILPGDEGTVSNPKTVEFVGIQDRAHAWREGITLAAQNKYQRRITVLTTESEGYIPLYGDLCQISHDVPGWGFSGRVEAFDHVTGVIITSEPLDFTTAGVNYNIGFRRRDGSMAGPYLIKPNPIGVGYGGIVQGTSSELAGIYISDGIREEQTFYQFGPSGKAGALCLAMSASPNNSGQVKLQFANYAPQVFLAETGGVLPPDDPISTLPTTPTAPIVDSVRLELSYEIGIQTIVASPAIGARYYEFAVSPDGTHWQNLGTSPDAFMRVSLATGGWYIRVRGVGLAVGPWTTAQVSIDAGTVLPLCEIGTFTGTPETLAIRLNWSIKGGGAGIAKTVEIRQNTANVFGNSVILATLPSEVSTFLMTNLNPAEVRFFWIRCIDEAGRAGPWYNAGVGLPFQASDNINNVLTGLEGQIEKSMLNQALQTEIESGGGAAVEVDAIKSELAAMYTIKTQLTVDGRTYIAGIGVGVENDQGIVESQVILSAQRVSIVDPSTPGSIKALFVATGGAVYMSTAFIQDGSITNLKVGDLQSNNYVAGTQGWRWAKDGTMENNGVGGTGRRKETNNSSLWYDANNVLRIKMQV